MTNKTLNSSFNTHKETTLFGRYIQTNHIAPLLKKHASTFKIDSIGQSVLKDNIASITIGTGEKKILMWSQMHGNEPTTTKALFDLLNYLAQSEQSDAILKTCTLLIIPILNPDGAKAYTRLNANGVDLNRDAQMLSQPESVVLNTVFNSFKPHFCFNLHGQRTIFSAGKTNHPATLSFLAPAQDQNCTITDVRKTAMSIIVKMNAMLQQEIPNQVGAYDDSFNINCVGDTFQSLNVPTILFEAGHYPNDYNREVVRRLVFQSYIIALNTIVEDTIKREDYHAYLTIPQNEKLFFDVIIKRALYDNEVVDIAVQYEEQLVDGAIDFVPKIEKIEKLDNFFAHNYLDAMGLQVLNVNNKQLAIGDQVDFVFINTVKCSLKFH